MITGLTSIDKNILEPLPKFYRAIVHSYCHVNSLFYAKNWGIPLVYNLFGTKNHPKIRPKWLQVGLCTALDLPLQGWTLDLGAIQMLVGKNPGDFLFCHSIQQQLGFCFPCLTSGGHELHPLLLLQSKNLLTDACSTKLDMFYWEQHLNVIALTQQDKKAIFIRMLKKCKVTKFWEINYKILARILATPVVLAAVLGDVSMMYCSFCGVVFCITLIARIGNSSTVETFMSRQFWQCGKGLATFLTKQAFHVVSHILTHFSFGSSSIITVSIWNWTCLMYIWTVWTEFLEIVVWTITVMTWIWLVHGMF